MIQVLITIVVHRCVSLMSFVSDLQVLWLISSGLYKISVSLCKCISFHLCCCSVQAEVVSTTSRLTDVCVWLADYTVVAWELQSAMQSAIN